MHQVIFNIAIGIGIILNLFSPILIRALSLEKSQEVVELGRLFFLTNRLYIVSFHYSLFIVTLYKAQGKTHRHWLELWNFHYRSQQRMFYKYVWIEFGWQRLQTQWHGLVRWYLPLMIACYMFKNKSSTWSRTVVSKLLFFCKCREAFLWQNEKMHEAR